MVIMRYAVGIVDGVAVSNSTIDHIPDYKPKENEVITNTKIKLPAQAVYDSDGVVIDFIPIPRKPTKVYKTKLEVTLETLTKRIEALETLALKLDKQFIPYTAIENEELEEG